jgi:hypothetical protein
MADLHEPLETNPILAGRLRIAEPSRLETRGATTALDEATGTRVIVARASKLELKEPERFGEPTHAHLCPILARLDEGDHWLVVSVDLRTRTPGASLLLDHVRAHGGQNAVEAVRTTLRIADALSTLHDLGQIHGRVHPENVIVGLPEDVNPCLVFGSPSPKEYMRPEHREVGSAPDPGDDTWATTALLYFVLTGSAPPAAGLGSLADLEGTKIDDPLLCEVLLHGLARDPDRRATTLFGLKRELARWFIAHAADERLPESTTVSHKPPPLPPSMAPHPRGASVRTGALIGAERIAGELRSNPSLRTATSVRAATSLRPAKPVWLRSVPLSVGAAVLGICVAWGISFLRKGEQTIVVQGRVVEQPTPSSAPSAEPIALAEVPVTGKEQQTGDAAGSCARGYLRDGTLGKSPELDRICKAPELPQALGLLRQAFVSSAGFAPPSASRFDSLAWYSLPTLFGLRQACCGENLVTLKLPDLGGSCPEFATSIDELARAISASQSLEPGIRKFAAAALCASKTGRAVGISAAPPSPVSERAFRELFVAASGAAESGSAHPQADTAPSNPPAGTGPVPAP